MTVRNDQAEPRSGRVALVVWSAGVLALTAALNQLVFATIESHVTIALTVLVVLVAGAPFALGLVGGVRQPFREVFLLAALGAGCFCRDPKCPARAFDDHPVTSWAGEANPRA